MSSKEEDGVVSWHADGVPMTELIPLYISDELEGGELQIYRGDHDVALALLDREQQLAKDKVSKYKHKMGYSTLGQFIRVLHSTAAIKNGLRVTLNLNLRSVDYPYIDDNHIYYLGADNPSFDWVESYIDDVKKRQLPAYLKSQSI